MSWAQIAAQSNGKSAAPGQGGSTSNQSAPVRLTQKWEIKWHCPMDRVDANLKKFITEEVPKVARLKGGSSFINIRCGENHAKTKKTTWQGGTRYTTMVNDKGGPHFTFEFWHEKRKVWFTVHYYIIAEEGADGSTTYRRNDRCPVDPNPKVFWESGTSEPLAVKAYPFQKKEVVWE